MNDDQEQQRLDLTMALAVEARELRARMRLQELMESPPSCGRCRFLIRPGPCPGRFPLAECPQGKATA